MSLTSHIMMVRPAAFGFNPETAATNEYQQKPATSTDANTHAQREFDDFVNLLRAHQVNVWVMHDNENPPKPDALFPNNWISTHADGTVMLYPMATACRRAERDPKILEELRKHFYVKSIIDMSDYEQHDKPLEGTGSMVLDRSNNYLYAGISPRTHADSVVAFSEYFDCHAVTFHAYSQSGMPYYHTNIMMSLGEDFAVVCLKSITDKTEHRQVVETLEKLGKEIIEITPTQTEKYFTGNMLQIKNEKGEKIVVLSHQAHQHLTPAQKSTLERHATLLPVSIPFIEQVGGGSVRCMMTEVFLPPIAPPH